jgi:hypothetical protein
MFSSVHLPSWGVVLACLFFAAIIAVAGLMPDALKLLLGAAAVGGLIFLAWRHLIGFSVAWLPVAATSTEMTLNDLIGPAAYGPAIAVVKAAQLGLAALCVQRYGSATAHVSTRSTQPGPTRRSSPPACCTGCTPARAWPTACDP